MSKTNLEVFDGTYTILQKQHSTTLIHSHQAFVAFDTNIFLLICGVTRLRQSARVCLDNEIMVRYDEKLLTVSDYEYRLLCDAALLITMLARMLKPP